ncbi:MAG: hypothetical protein K6F88_08120 [Ruminococcus sp.]|nr:hypothetical protein [Ruminococcus sp.]
MKKRDYLSPEFEFLEVILPMDVLLTSIDDINHDHVDVDDDDLNDETDPDVNSDFHDYGDGSDLFN